MLKNSGRMKLPHKHSRGNLSMSKPIIQLNEENVKSELKELVRSGVEETPYELLNKEAEKLTSAAKHERTEARQGYRSRHYSRKLTFALLEHIFLRSQEGSGHPEQRQNKQTDLCSFVLFHIL